jgi:hypothetical protein
MRILHSTFFQPGNYGNISIGNIGKCIDTDVFKADITCNGKQCRYKKYEKPILQRKGKYGIDKLVHARLLIFE